MPSFIQNARALATKTAKDSLEDDVLSMAAAIAYYTIFSLPPLLVTTVLVAGAVFGGETVRDALFGQVDSLVGPEGAAAIGEMLDNAGELAGGIEARILGIGILLFGASVSFIQLQKSLNRAWGVEDQGGGVKGLITKRLLSFGMVLTIGFFLLVSLALSAFLTAIGNVASGFAPSGLMRLGMQAANFALSLGIITALFALLFRYLPDLHLKWREVLPGALFTAVLFTIGKTLIGLYLGTANPGSAFGAAGSLALVLVWIYYSALIVLVGAEFTQAWAKQFGDFEAEREKRGAKGRGKKGEEGADEAEGDLHPLAQPREPAPY